MQMLIASRRKEVKTLSYEILKRASMSVKFKTKLFIKNMLDQQAYYHQEYIYNMNNEKCTSVNLSPNSFIQISITDENYKDALILNEVSRNRLIRKSNSLIGLLEAYDSSDIDILTVSSTGTRIMSCFSNESVVKLNINKKNVCIEAVYRDISSDVGVSITIDEANAVISIHDFLDTMYKIRSINFIEMTMFLINYLGSPEIGENSIDFRKDLDYNPEAELSLYGNGSVNTMKNFDGLKINKPNNNNKTKYLNW